MKKFFHLFNNYDLDPTICAVEFPEHLAGEMKRVLARSCDKVFEIDEDEFNELRDLATGDNVEDRETISRSGDVTGHVVKGGGR